MEEKAYLITAIVSLSSTVVALWFNIKSKDKKLLEMAEKMTEAMLGNKHVIENNTKAVDKLYSYIVK